MILSMIWTMEMRKVGWIGIRRRSFFTSSLPHHCSSLLFFLFSLAFSATDTMPSTFPRYFQYSISITAPCRGCHLITNDILKPIQKDLREIDIGLCNIFVQHTSCSLTINENADPDVRTDMETALNKLVPASYCRDGTFRHSK